MNENENADKVYGRVEGDKVVEYPVYPIHIKTRAHPLSMYVEVLFDKRPEIPEFFSLKENVYVERGDIRVSYDVLPFPLHTLLRLATEDSNNIDLLEAKDVLASEVDQALVKRIVTLINGYIQTKLDAFANERGYDNVVTLISYETSGVKEYKADAKKGKEMRDQVWSATTAYVNDILADAKPIPKSITEIDEALPSIAWE